MAARGIRTKRLSSSRSATMVSTGKTAHQWTTRYTGQPLSHSTLPPNHETAPNPMISITGPGWRRARASVGLEPVTRLADDIVRTAWAALALLSSMIGVGGLVLAEWRTALIGAALLAVGIVGLQRHKGERAVA